MEDWAAYKVAQAKRKRVWCEKCKQYGHTIAECLDEEQEQRNQEIEREILKRKQLEEIDKKMQQVKRQTERDIGKPPKIGILEITLQEVENPQLSLENQTGNLNHHHPLGKVHPQAHQ